MVAGTAGINGNEHTLIHYGFHQINLLKTPEIALWQDRAQLEGGLGWWRQIAAALDNVDFLVLVLTPAAIHSPVV